MITDFGALWLTRKEGGNFPYSDKFMASLGSGSRPAGLINPADPILLEEPVVKELANPKGVSAAQILIAWSLTKGISVIPQSSNPERLKQNFQAQYIQLNEKDMAMLSALERDTLYRWLVLVWCQ